MNLMTAMLRGFVQGARETPAGFFSPNPVAGLISSSRRKIKAIALPHTQRIHPAAAANANASSPEVAGAKLERFTIFRNQDAALERIFDNVLPQVGAGDSRVVHGIHMHGHNLRIRGERVRPKCIPRTHDDPRIKTRDASIASIEDDNIRFIAIDRILYFIRPDGISSKVDRW